MSEFWVVTSCLFVLSVVTRALPFVMKDLITPRIDKLGKRLPAFIMMLLVVYEVNLNKIIEPPFGIPAFGALCLVVIVQLYFRKTFLSLFIGTIFYLILQMWLGT